MNMYERIYQKLSKIIDLDKLRLKGALKYISKGFMDLNLDFLFAGENGSFRIAMAHNFVQNGDLMTDPDMEIRILPSMRMAEALTFQQDFLGIYQQVYTEKNGQTSVSQTTKKQLNAFLNQWLSNIQSQNYKLILT